MAVSPRQVSPVPLPADLARERSVLLHRALRELPVLLLEPMLTGLRRHSDALTAGSLYSDDGGGCAVGMMLREISKRPGSAREVRRPLERLWPKRLRFQSPTIREERPDLAKANPRLHHLELIFDVTCERMVAALGLSPAQAARSVGLWMAAETQAEINLRHVEFSVDLEASHALPAVALDERLFSDTVARLRQLRPWLSEGQASRVVEGWIGARRVEFSPLFLPDDWATEVTLQRDRLAAAGTTS